MSTMCAVKVNVFACIPIPGRQIFGQPVTPNFASAASFARRAFISSALSLELDRGKPSFHQSRSRSARGVSFHRIREGNSMAYDPCCLSLTSWKRGL